MVRIRDLSQRQLRVGEVVRHALTDVLSKLDFSDDSVLSGCMISITQVEMSADLKLATCFVSSMTDTDISILSSSLQSRSGFLRHQCLPSLRSLRYLPTFRFLPDTSFNNSSRIDELLSSDFVRRDLESSSSSASSSGSDNF